MTREELVKKVSVCLHAERRTDAARLIAEFSGIKFPTNITEDIVLQLCNSLLYWCLENEKPEWAAQMLWNESLFSFEPDCTKHIWKKIDESSSLMLMGSASMSKSYGAGVWLLLQWVRDPEYTSVNIAGPSEDHLKDNLFSHFVTLHSQASLPLPGYTGDLFIGLDSKKRKGAIRGIVFPIGKKPSGRLQGRKRVPRKTPHPKLGRMSRMFIMLDELEKIPIGVFKDLDNAFANLDTDPGSFKIITAFNPEDPNGPTAERCEPEKGWTEVNPDTDYEWVSKRGWNVLRLDAARCENVVQKRLVYPGLQTYEGYQRIIQNAGGTDTPAYWTMCRAMFPRGGAVYNIFSTMLVDRMKGAQFLFAEEPMPCAAIDLALEGKDPIEMAVDKFGKVYGLRYFPSLDYPSGRDVLFKDKNNQRRIRWGLQVDQLFQLPNADTVKMAIKIKEECIRLGISPGWVLLDRTGNGAGVHDLLKNLWSAEVRGLNYTEAATERKILAEDTKTAKEEYERAVSELWFATKKWSEFNFVRLGPLAYSEDLAKQLLGRRYQVGKLTRVESKDDYKSRGSPSPNKADAFTLLIHLVRMASGVVPSALDDCAGTQITGERLNTSVVPVFVGHTDILETLEDEEWMN